MEQKQGHVLPRNMLQPNVTVFIVTYMLQFDLFVWAFLGTANGHERHGQIPGDATSAECTSGILVILISLAFPFFGVINSFLGAGTTTLETYIIPALAYNWVYRRSSAQIACPAPPPW